MLIVNNVVAENAEAATTTADIPLFRTEEGRYLATCKLQNLFKKVLLTFFFLALGDPLIKGLTEVANKRPEDPIAYLATYLYNFANNNNNNKRVKTQESRKLNQDEIQAADNKNNPVDVVAVDPKNNEDSIPNDTAFSAATRVRNFVFNHFASSKNDFRINF